MMGLICKHVAVAFIWTFLDLYIWFAYFRAWWSLALFASIFSWIPPLELFLLSRI